MREWSPGAQKGLLGHLAMMVEQGEPESEVELWRVRKADRKLRCVAVYLPTGIDVRLLEGDCFGRTQLCKIAPELEKLSEEWLRALQERGWTLSPNAR